MFQNISKRMFFINDKQLLMNYNIKFHLSNHSYRNISGKDWYISFSLLAENQQISGNLWGNRKLKIYHAQPGSAGRLVFYGFSNEAGQYVSEQCLVQPLYSSEGGPPTWSQWWSKYCCMATSPSLARRVNCGRTAGLCYLSLPPDHRAEAWGGEYDHASPPSHCESPTLGPPRLGQEAS